MGLSNSSRNQRVLLAALAAGLLIRIVFILTYQTLPVSDEAEYDRLAQSIVYLGEYAVDGVPTAYRPPGYPAFLAASYFLFGHDILIPKILQAILDTLTAYMLFSIGRMRSERVGLIAALAWAFFVPAVLFVNLLMTESLTAFLLVVSIFMFSGAGAENSIPRMLGSGLVIGICILFKPGLLLVPMLLLFFSALRPIRPRQAILVLAGALSIIFPWMIRNQIVLGTFSLSTNTGMNLYIGNNPEASGAYRGVFSSDLTDSSLTEVGRDQKAMSKAKEYIISNPGTFLLNGLKKSVHLFRSEGDVLIAAFTRDSSPIGIGFKQRYRSVPILFTILTNTVSFTVLLAGIIGFSISSRNHQFWLTLSVVLALLGTHVVFFGSSRFHFILMPFAVLYSSEALTACLKKELTFSGGQKLVVVSAFVILAAIWSYELSAVFTG